MGNLLGIYEEIVRERLDYRFDSIMPEITDFFKNWPIYDNGSLYFFREFKNVSVMCTLDYSKDIIWRVRKSGSESWKMSRIDGPAYHNIRGSKSWFLNGKKHREDGPAIEEGPNSSWWWNGVKLDVTSQSEFEERKNELMVLEVMED